MITRSITIAALLLAPAAYAGDYNDDIQSFFELYESGKVIEALDRVYSTNPWINAKSDSVTKVKTQLSGIGELVGAYVGKERIGEQKIGDRLVHVTYLALYQRQPVRMEFQYYRPAEDWIIYSYSFDDKIDDELSQAARDAIATGKSN